MTRGVVLLGLIAIGLNLPMTAGSLEEPSEIAFLQLLREYPGSMGSISVLSGEGGSTTPATGAEIEAWLLGVGLPPLPPTKALVGFGSSSPEIREAVAWPHCYTVFTRVYYRWPGEPFQLEISESQIDPESPLAPPPVCGTPARRWTIIYGGPETTLIQLCGAVEVALVTDTPMGGAGGSGCGARGILDVSGVLHRLVFLGLAYDYFHGSEGSLVIR